MGQSFSFADPKRVALVIATGRKYVTHAQAMVDCYPSSLLSDADKQHCFKALEERPSTAGMLLLDPHANVRHIQRHLITGLLRYQLKEPNRPHHYRGYAERSPPDAPPVVPPEDAPSDVAASALDLDAPVHPALAACKANSIAARISSALHDTNGQQHERGRADEIPPDAPPAVAPEAAPSSASASAAAAAASSVREDPPDPDVASSESSSSSSASSSSHVADEADEWAADEELITLLAKKTQ